MKHEEPKPHPSHTSHPSHTQFMPAPPPLVIVEDGSPSAEQQSVMQQEQQEQQEQFVHAPRSTLHGPGGIADRVAGREMVGTRPGPGVEPPLPERPALDRIADALEQLVALALYHLDMPLPTVESADPSGLVALAIEAKKLELIEQSRSQVLAEDQRRLKELLKDGPESLLKDRPYSPVAGSNPNHADDDTFYDGVRRLLEYLHEPFDELDPGALDTAAHGHGWTRENIREMVEGFGLD